MWVLGGVLAASLVLGWAIRLPEIGTGEDEAVYLLLSESVGDGHYRDLGIPGTPPHAKYPPGTAAWIFLVRTTMGENLDAVRMGNLLLLCLAGILMADGWRRLRLPWIGIGAAAVTILNPVLLDVATTLSSEPLYLALSAGALWATLLPPMQSKLRWGLVVTALAVMAFLTRLVGIGVLAGIGGWALFSRRWRLASAHAAASAAVVLGWFLYLRSAMAQTVAQTYGSDLAGRISAARLQIVQDAVVYVGQLLPDVLQLPMMAGTRVDNVLVVLVLGSTGLLGLLGILRRWPALGWTVVASAAVLVLWGWPTNRLFLPLLPGLAGAVLLGALLAGQRFMPRYPASLSLLLALVLGGVAARGAIVRAQEAAPCRAVDQYAAEDCTSPGQRALVQAARTLSDSLPSGAVLATPKPSTVHWFSRRTVVPLRVVARGDDSEGILPEPGAPASFSHLLLTPLTSQELNRVGPALLSHCQRLGLVARFSAGALLFSLDPALGRPGACEALATFSQTFPPTPPDR